MDTWLNHTYKSALESLPSTLSIPLKTIADKIEKKNYAEAFDCLLKFFEMSVQYLSCILFLQIQKKDRYNDTLEKVVIYIYCKPSLSFGDWVNAIFRGLCKESRKLLPEHPLIKPLTEKTVKAILDGEPDLVKIRNKKAHGTILSDTECQEKINALKPRFDAMLTLLQPLQQWDYLTCCQQENISLKGCNTPCSIESSHNLEELHYYIRFSEEDLFDLYPLICHEEKFVYVFQTIKRGGGIGYISSDENAPENPNKNNVDDFYKCVAKTYPAWKTILARTKTASLQFIEQAQKDKKYNKDFFVDREKLTKFFQDFCNSDKRLFSLPGEAGQGKTSQLCNWTEKLIEDGKSVLIFSSSDFSAQNTKDKESPLEQKLRAVFDDSSDIKMEVLLDNIHEKASEQNEYIYFFFDAINECLTYSHSKGETETSNGPLSLYKDIVKFLVERDYPHFKVLFTCRSYTWGKSIRPEIKEEKQHLFGEDKDITVHGFTDKELEEAFQKYQDLYQMETCFQDLERRVAIRLKDPLMLKIACTNYLSKELPADTDYYTSISLFEKMVDDIKTSYAGNGQYQIIYEIANYIFDRYEHETPEDSVSLNNLPPVFEKLINNENGKTPAYYELFNRTERPVLRLSSTDELQFVYERFLEYMMALVFVERGELNAKSFVDELKKVKQNAVFLGAMRNALIMHLRKTKDLTIIVQLIKENGDDLEIKYLLTETLNVLINENHEQLIFELINKLINEQIPNSIVNIKKFNDNEKLIENNKANEEVMKKRNEAYNELLPLLRLREYAVVSVVNGLF
ncbi:MAG: hypothetical protein LBU51_02325, partial [Bacteroidales bacterium]|nr:hypothetical protein [Bacteroidales bacterium]